MPNIQQKEKIIRSKGCEALIEVANAQILLYEVENLSPPKSMSDLISKGYLKDTQRRCPNGDTIEISNGQAAVRQRVHPGGNAACFASALCATACDTAAEAAAAHPAAYGCAADT